MRERRFGLSTLLRLRRRDEQRQALALGKIVTLRTQQNQRRDWLRDEEERAWSLGVEEPHRDARLLWLKHRLHTLTREQQEWGERLLEQQRLFQHARRRRLSLARLLERRMREQRREQKKRQEHEILDSLLQTAQGEC